MGKDTDIAWCDHTFNPWWGCVKISPGCTRCYAATFDKRVHGKDSEYWKVGGPRRKFGDAHWRQPEKWNRDAAKAGKRARVFCASMADVFEDRRDLDADRDRLWALIERTPHLDWLLLTKRPDVMRRLWPWSSPPANVWAGTTMEDQEHADARIVDLLNVPAVVRFASIEPMIGPVELQTPMPLTPADVRQHHRSYLRGVGGDVRLGWIIAGCESGHGARPAQVQWYRDLRDQCTAAGVPFLLKQAAEQPGAPGRLYQIGAGAGSWRKGRVLIEAPYLDGVQHLAWPEVRRG